jgi:hypothetical protein
MSLSDENRLKLYSIRIVGSDGSEVVFPSKALSTESAEALPKQLTALAAEVGFPLLSVKVELVTADDRSRVLDEARDFFNRARSWKPVRAVDIGVQCSACHAVAPLSEALDVAGAPDFLSGDPIAGDSRCEECSRHSVENCYECRTEWVIANDTSFRFLCASCRQAVEPSLPGSGLTQDLK